MVEWAIFQSIYKLSIEKRSFKSVIAKRSLLVTHLLMATQCIDLVHMYLYSLWFLQVVTVWILANQYEKKEYVKPDMFFMRQLCEAKKNMSLNTNITFSSFEMKSLARCSIGTTLRSSKSSLLVNFNRILSWTFSMYGISVNLNFSKMGRRSIIFLRYAIILLSLVVAINLAHYQLWIAINKEHFLLASSWIIQCQLRTPHILLRCLRSWI